MRSKVTGLRWLVPQWQLPDPVTSPVPAVSIYPPASHHNNRARAAQGAAEAPTPIWQHTLSRLEGEGQAWCRMMPVWQKNISTSFLHTQGMSSESCNILPYTLPWAQVFIPPQPLPLPLPSHTRLGGWKAEGSKLAVCRCVSWMSQTGYFLQGQGRVQAAVQVRSQLQWASCPIQRAQEAQGRLLVHTGRTAMTLSYKRRPGQLGLASPAKGKKNRCDDCSASVPGKLQCRKSVNLKKGTDLSESKWSDY